MFELSNNKLYLKQKDPYGFWYVNFDKGQVPEALKSAFTSFHDAQRAVELYLSEKKRDIKGFKD